MGAILGFLGGGNPLRAWITGGLVVAVLLLAGFGAWQLDRVSTRDKTIGQMAERIDGLNGELAGERTERLQDRAFAALNARLHRDAMGQVQTLNRRLRDMERTIHARPIAADIEAACRPVLDAFNDDLAGGLRGLIPGAADGDAAEAGRSGAGGDPALRSAGGTGALRKPD